MIKLIVFDLDGVLVKSVEAFNDTYLETLSQFGLEAKVADLTKNYGKPYVEIFRGVIKEEWVVKIVYKRFLEILQSDYFYERVGYLDGMEEFLKKLKKKYKVAIATGNSRWFAEQCIRKYGLWDLVDEVVTSDDVARGKPYPDMLLKLMKRFSTNNTEVIYVGDTKDDLMMGKTACVKTYAVLTGVLEREEAKKLTDNIVDNVKQIAKYLPAR
jgi:HAD superfamily hydrolase (TIGR01549 family)